MNFFWLLSPSTNSRNLLHYSMKFFKFLLTSSTFFELLSIIFFELLLPFTNFYILLWDSIDFYNFLWNSIDFKNLLWHYITFYILLWTSRTLYKFTFTTLWPSINFYLILQFPMILCWLLLPFMNISNLLQPSMKCINLYWHQ